MLRNNLTKQECPEDAEWLQGQLVGSVLCSSPIIQNLRAQLSASQREPVPFTRRAYLHLCLRQTPNGEKTSSLLFNHVWPRTCCLVFSHLFSRKPCVWACVCVCVCVCVLIAQLCPALCNPVDCSSSVHGIFQARTLEWVAISFSKGSSQSRDRIQVWLHCRQILYQLSHQRSPQIRVKRHILYLTAICSNFTKFLSLNY